MKKNIYKILSILSILAFSMYWTVAFLWSLPDFKSKNSIQKKVNLPKTLFVSGWKLFTPPFINDQRLYYIVRNVKKAFLADTIEVLKNISIQKQHNAPFNQREVILDYLVNKNVVHLIKTGWMIHKESDTVGSAILSTDKIHQSTGMTQNSINQQMYLSSLFNFGRVVLKERNINIDGKEMKIVIKQKIMRPFEEMNDTNFVRTETTVFESVYLPFK